MNLETIVQALHLSVKSGGDRLGVEVRGGYVGDLLSDVMANSREGDLWITRQIHQNIVAVASLKDLAGIILVRGAVPAADTLEKAVRENIPLLTTDLPAFETAGGIHRMICPQKA
jgi:hypothetical protein